MSALDRVVVVLAATILAAPATTRAGEIVALLPATGVNVDAGTLAAAGEVMRGHLVRAGLDVRLVATANPDVEPGPTEAGAAATSVGATRAGAVRLVTLGATLRARFTVYDPSGRQVHYDEMAANAVDDLDATLERLARGYAKGSTAARSADLDTVTQKEAAGVQKAQASSAFGLRLGGVRPTGTLDGGIAATGGGIYWFYDTRAIFIDVAFDGYWAKGTQQYSGGFGGYLPFSKGNLAPYAGAGLRYAWANYGHGSGRGFQPYAEVGLLIGRLSTASIRGQLQWWWNTFENDGMRASGATWNLGVQF